MNNPKTLRMCFRNMQIDGAERWYELRAESQSNAEADAKLGLEVMAATGYNFRIGTITNWRVKHGVKFNDGTEMSDAEFEELVRDFIIPGQTWESAIKKDAIMQEAAI